MSKIRIAVQKKGRLRRKTESFLRSLGLEFDRESKRLIEPLRNADMELLFVRNSDIPEYIKDSVADFGIVGQNVLLEGKNDLKVIKSLGFGACQLVIAIPTESDIKTLADLNDERIATSYVNSLKTFLTSNNINASLIPISGSVEIAPELGLADAVCDITQTGDTLNAHNLVPLATILNSEAVLIESPQAKKQKRLFLDLLTTQKYEGRDTKTIQAKQAF